MDAPDAVFRLQVSEGARLVLVLLWRYAGAGQDPVVWPSKATLAERTGMNTRSIARILVTLREAGAIERCSRPPSAQTRGPAWRLNSFPDDRPTMTERSYDPQVSDRSVTPIVTARSPPHDRAVTPPMTDVSPEPTREPPEEPTKEPTTMFELAPVPAKRTPKPKPKSKPGCTDEQWAVVVEAWAEARELGGMPTQWGRMRDNPTNRKHAARIWADGYTEADIRAVMRHIGHGLARGTHEPRWAVLEHVARTMERYVQQALASDQRPQGKYSARGAVCYEPVEHDPPPEVYEAEIAAAFDRAGQ